jgi:hypothetical protein
LTSLIGSYCVTDGSVELMVTVPGMERSHDGSVI